MRQAHNIVTFSVFRDGSGTNLVEVGASTAETNVATPAQADLQRNVSVDANGGYFAVRIVNDIQGMGVLPSLDEQPSKVGEEHKSPQQENTEVHKEMIDHNLKKYKCIKSGCAYLTNSIINIATHKKNHDDLEEVKVEHLVMNKYKKHLLNEVDTGPSIKKIKVMRRNESLPGLKCEHCPNMSYSFVSASDLSRHIEEVHGDFAELLKEPQHEKKGESSNDSPPLQIMTVSSSTPKENEVPKRIPRILRAGGGPSLQVQHVPIINLGQKQPPIQQEVKPIGGCSMLMVSNSLQSLNMKSLQVLKAEAAAHNVQYAGRYR